MGFVWVYVPPQPHFSPPASVRRTHAQQRTPKRAPHASEICAGTHASARARCQVKPFYRPSLVPAFADGSAARMRTSGQLPPPPPPCMSVPLFLSFTRHVVSFLPVDNDGGGGRGGGGGGGGGGAVAGRQGWQGGGNWIVVGKSLPGGRGSPLLSVSVTTNSAARSPQLVSIQPWQRRRRGGDGTEGQRAREEQKGKHPPTPQQ